jgi:hypothetical protein
VLWTDGEKSARARRVPRVTAVELTPAAFRERYLAQSLPVIITGAIDAWPAMGGGANMSDGGVPGGEGSSDGGGGGGLRGWADLEYLKRAAGDRLIPVEVCNAEDRTTT